MKTTKHNPQLADTDAEGTPRRIDLTSTIHSTEMTKDELKNRIAVEQAYLNGEEIEAIDIRNQHTNEWHPCPYPVFNWDYVRYRVKPTPKYIPFDSPEKVLNAIKEHGSFVKPTTKPLAWYDRIVGITPHSVHIYDCGMASTLLPSYMQFLEEYTFADGTPCGIRVEPVDSLKAN